MHRAAVLLVLLAGAGPAAQSGDVPAFEVASVKRTKPDASGGGGGFFPDGRVAFANIPLRNLIAIAYQLSNYELVGGPDWIQTERFDIEARAPQGAPADPGQLRLRNLLADRFGLVIRREMREMPVYSLVLARSDGRLGPSLRKSEFDCSPGRRPAGRVTTPDGLPVCRPMWSTGEYVGAGVPFTTVVNMLSGELNAPVTDRTALSGAFDLKLEWASEFGSRNDNLPSFVTAVQEQLGLRLQRERGPVEVVVIESVRQPTEN